MVYNWPSFKRHEGLAPVSVIFITIGVLKNTPRLLQNKAGLISSLLNNRDYRYYVFK